MEGVSRVLSLRLVKNQTRNGKIPRFVALVAYGNRNGGLGLGKARHAQPADAVEKATSMSRRSVSFYEIHENRTLFHDDQVKFKASVVQVRPTPRGILAHVIA
jgi:ribosomal protein S5